MMNHKCLIRDAFLLLSAGIMLLTNIAGAVSKNQADPTSVNGKPRHTVLLDTHHNKSVVIVKFADELTVRLRDARLTDLGTGDLEGAQATLDSFGVGVWSRMHGNVSEQQLDAWRTNAVLNLRKSVADLNTEFYLNVPTGMSAATVCDTLNALTVVELARPAPLPVRPPGTPNFEAAQQYLNPATNGVDAECMWNVPGGTGINVNVCDIEYSWNFDHEDLPAFTLLGGTPDNPFNSLEHGTAVLGELVGVNNGFGVTGIAYNATAFVAAAKTQGNVYNLAGAISTALATLSVGDFILIEQQAAGPNWPGGKSDFGLVPSEWDLSVYNAIVVAVGNGVTVVEAAGNGSQDLDSADYNVGHAPFLPGNDSGAIIVGAGASPGSVDGDRSRLDFSCYGSTVDVQGIGENVVTTGYGDLYNSEGMNLWFTGTFNGTSSSSPIVCGAGILVQSAYNQATGMNLTPAEIRDALIATGSPQQDGTNPATEHIGPRPNAAAAFAYVYPADDCNSNFVPDECDPDCNGNNMADDCDITDNTSLDCNNNMVPDECDLASGFSFDCNNNNIPDECDITNNVSLDCQPNGIPDECELGNCLNQIQHGIAPIFSDIDCDGCGANNVQIAADNFTSSFGELITGVMFWGGYLNGSSAIHDAFTIILRSDAGGLPGAAITSFGPMEADLKLGVGGGVYEYTVIFPVPVAVPAGTTWVEIYNNTAGSTTIWRWSDAVLDPQAGVAGGAFSFTVPEQWVAVPAELAVRVFCATNFDNDCNANGVPDDCEITAGGDCNNNFVLDVCETKPEGDPAVAVEHDECVDADIVCPGFNYAGCNVGATSSMPFFCGLYYGTQDVYYRYRPAYDGTLFVRVEGPPIYWLYAIYDGCPPGGNEIKCNETDHFQIVVNVLAGRDYYIRIASWGLNPAGSFEMNLVGPECALNPIDLNGNMIPDECECLADINNSGAVDMADAMLVAAAQGTQCAACAEDVNGDGVVDATDWAIVLNSLGPCPFP